MKLSEHIGSEEGQISKRRSPFYMNSMKHSHRPKALVSSLQHSGDQMSLKDPKMRMTMQKKAKRAKRVDQD